MFMFSTPRIIKGSFNRYYVLARFSNSLPLGWNIRSVDLRGCAKMFVRQLDVPDSYWRQLLFTQSHIDLRHVRQSDDVLIAELLASGRIRAYAVPGPAEIKQLASCAVNDKRTGVKYVFLPENAPLLVNATHRRRFDSLKDAESFLKTASLKDEQINTLVSFLKHEASAQQSKRERLVHALVNGSLAVGIAPASAPAKTQSTLLEGVTSLSRLVSLGPHVEMGYVAPAAAPSASVKPANPPAQSLEECEQRLAAARERLINNGYQSKYNDEQLHAMAQKGEMDDRFVARLIKNYAKDDDYLGRVDNGEVKYWSTTFNQMENADTDPKTLSLLFGIDYDPKGDYPLVVVDSQAKGAGQSTTIVPTHKNLGNFAKTEIKGINPDAVDQVMTPEYNQEYAEHMVAFKKRELSIDEQKDIDRYADANLSTDADKTAFEARIKINERLGANEHYTGNGTSKNLIADCPNECGVMETFTYDKNPQTLANLESSGSAKRIPAKPL